MRTVAIDTETTGLDVWHGDRPFALAMAWDSGETRYWQWPVDPLTRKVDYGRADNLQPIRSVLLDPEVCKVFHNSKFDVRMMEAAWDIQTVGPIADTMYAAHACDSLEDSYGLKQLAEKYLGIGAEDKGELRKRVISLRRQQKPKGWKLALQPDADYWLPKAVDPEDTLCETYCVRDTIRTLQLWQMYQEVMTELKTWDQYLEEMALWPITYAMESRGVRCDPVICKEEIKRHRELLQQAEACLKARARNKRFNVRSAKQLSNLLYKAEGCPVLAKTPKGAPSTAFEVLEQLGSYPVVREVLTYRACAKGIQFFEQYLGCMTPEGSLQVIHPEFNQVRPITGRYSCSNPNLQQVADPKGGKGAVPISARKPFGPRPGYVWYHFDYQQLEVRVFAFVSGERFLQEALLRGEDVHTASANRAWGGPNNPAAIRAAMQALELIGGSQPSSEPVKAVWDRWNIRDPSKEPDVVLSAAAADWLASHGWRIVEAEASLGKRTTRTRGKNFLFGKLFGGGIPYVKKLVHCEDEEAALMLAEYDTAFPQIRDYIDRIGRQARRDGYIRTTYGRRISVDRDATFRACNYMVQGSAAGLLKRSMVRVAELLRASGKDAHLVLTIHDELVIEIKREHATRKLISDVCNIMADNEGHFGDMPTPVEVACAKQSWAEKEPVTWLAANRQTGNGSSGNGTLSSPAKAATGPRR